jgi:hypothetical protein
VYPAQDDLVVGAMQTADGQWRIEAIKRAGQEHFRPLHDGNVVDGARKSIGLRVRLIVNGNLDAVTRFSGNQLADERRKQEFLEAHPELAPALFRLEDHPILRGTLSAFEFDSETFAQRARAFEIALADRRQWLGLTGALLTFGDYQRQRPNLASWQFGSADNEAVWRDLLTNATYRRLQSIRTVLGQLLDGLADSDTDPSGYFKHVIAAWLAGIQPNQVEIQRDNPTTLPCRKNSPHSPYTTLGTAAIRSTMLTSRRCQAPVAISEMNKAVPVASGTEMHTATNAISTVPVSTAAMPKWWASGSSGRLLRWRQGVIDRGTRPGGSVGSAPAGAEGPECQRCGVPGGSRRSCRAAVPGGTRVTELGPGVDLVGPSLFMIVSLTVRDDDERCGSGGQARGDAAASQRAAVASAAGG